MLGYVDEVWWSRLAQPNMHAWSFDKPFRLIEQQVDKQDKEPKALACYGVWLPEEKNMLLRFADSRPVSIVTCSFLNWACQRLEEKSKRVWPAPRWALVWDNASWHISQQVQQWIEEHNEQVKQKGGVRIITCLLPVKSPWLNPIEAKWLHGKRAVVEPQAKPSKKQLMERVYQHYDCKQVEPIPQITS